MANIKLKKVAEVDVRVQRPFNFRRTIGKPAGWHWSTPGEVYEDGVLWSGFYFRGKPVGLKMWSEGGKTRAFVYGKKKLSIEEKKALADELAAGLGGKEDLAGFYRMAKRDAILRDVVKRLHGMRFGQLDDVFGRVILTITLQLAPIKRSNDMMDDILKYYGTRLQFDRKTVTLWPPPQRIAKLKKLEFQKKANLGYRSKLLIDAAKYLVINPVSFRDLEQLPLEEAIKEIQKVPGVGEYSASIILNRENAAIDVWSVIVMSELLTGKTPKNPREAVPRIDKLVKKRWGKWSWLAFVYILNDLPRLQKKYGLSRIQ